jgi:hypothetical protein
VRGWHALASAIPELVKQLEDYCLDDDPDGNVLWPGTESRPDLPRVEH